MIPSIELASIIDLLEIASDSSSGSISYIQEKYERKHSCFEEALETAKRFSLIVETNRCLANICSPKEAKNLIVQEIISEPKDYLEIWGFLKQFALNDGNYTFPMIRSHLVVYQIERRFLEDLGVVAACDGFYRIASEPVISCLNNKSKLSNRMLHEILLRQQYVGNLAEDYVLEYEIGEFRRFAIDGPERLIKRISEEDVGAGYDIIGFSREQAKMGNYSPIFIEVKAISEEYSEFYWSRNEMDTANKLQEDYYLYLVTIGKNDMCKSIKIINNPILNVLENDAWQKLPESIRIWKTIEPSEDNYA
jgi:hypothetical protein